MGKSIVISVVIPVFNVERYLEKCIESVVTQIYPYLEVILVDDGSQDNSAQICDCFASEYKNVQVIHQENGGLSSARNAGIHLAAGEYITFLDGDDFWDDPNALQRIADRLQKTAPDVLNYSYAKYFESTSEKKPYFSNLSDMPADLCGPDSIEYITERGLYIASACNKVIRRCLLDEKMQFVPGIYSEDIEWCARLLRAAKSMDFIGENFYCYRQRESSITHTIDNKKCVDLCNNIIGCLRLCETAEQPQKRWLCRYTAYQYGTFFAVQAQAKNVPEQSIRQLQKYTDILRYGGYDRKLKVLKFCCCIVGYVNTCRFIRFLKQR